MAAKLLLGADVPNKMDEVTLLMPCSFLLILPAATLTTTLCVFKDGHMEYHLSRPVGGHGKVFIDVLYLDEDILIMRGHHGTIYAMARSNVSQRYAAMRQSNAEE